MKKTILISLAASITMPIVALSQKKATKENKTTSSEVISPSLEINKEYSTASGLKYKIIKKGNGKKPQTGDNVSVHYVGKLTNDTVFDSSRKRGQPFLFVLGAQQVIRGWDEGIALLQVGDVAILTIPSTLGYGDREMSIIPANSTLIFEVELMDVKESPRMWDLKGMKIDSTASGLKYIVVKKADAKAPKAENGKSVSVHYSGFFENGKLFDSSVQRGQPFEFTLGTGQVIKGWDEGIALMHVGDKMRLIIPYYLAYGETGRGSIPPKATLIFDVELMNVH